MIIFLKRSTSFTRFSSVLQRKAPQCLVIHPVLSPNKGPIIQQYLAQEAIGLVSSLRWEVVAGPFWRKSTKQQLRSKIDKLPPNTVYMQPQYGSELKDGAYVKTSVGSGILYKDGIVFDQESTETDGDLHNQWTNKNIRQSLANYSLMKCRKVTQKYYFTKGKLEKVIAHVLSKQPTCLFINSQLKPGQIRNLKKLLQSQLNNKALPKGYLYGGADQDNSQTQLETNSEEVSQQKQGGDQEKARRGKNPYKKIQIFDRFSIILQIFAKRTTSKLAKLQIELSYLAYLKTRLVRDGSTYSSNTNFFNGDLLNVSQMSLEIISAKQRRALGTMSGEGQSQLEIQRRNIRNKEAKIRRQIEIQTRLRESKKDKQKNRHLSTNLPIIAIVGYTNVGKSAFMNYLIGKNEVQSKDLLFQTLKTTSRYVQLPSGSKIMLLDTIGFITNLPSEMIDAFKSTLEDISHADLVIHLRDLSHPQNQHQKESVLKILKELNFPPQFYNKKMIQVWNKVDLVTSPQLISLEGSEKSKQNFQISCLTGKNIGAFLTYLDRRIKEIKGLTIRRITYGFQKHHRVIEWLKKNGNVSYNLNQEHCYETSEEYPQGSVTISVDIDEVVEKKLQKFLNQISGKQVEKGKKSKGLPPKEGW